MPTSSHTHSRRCLFVEVDSLMLVAIAGRRVMLPHGNPFSRIVKNESWKVIFGEPGWSRLGYLIPKPGSWNWQEYRSNTETEFVQL